MKLLFASLAALFAATVSSAKLVTQPIAYEHAGVKLQGYLAYDHEKTAARKVPGVLIIPEWWGITDYVKGRAEMLAKLGYVALVADMYGGGVSTTDPKKAGEYASAFYGKPLMAERARAGLDQLLKNSSVDSSHVAAIGYCFGGSCVQALAFSGAPLNGIVSFHGAFVPVPDDAAAKTKAKILICHGAMDPFVKKDALDAFLKRLDEGKFDYQFVSYNGAVHAFTNPDADKAAAAGLKGVGYNAAADRRSWAHLRVFFDEIFGPQP